MEPFSLVVVSSFHSPVEAQIAKGILDETGIQSMIRADNAGGMYPAMGAAELLVRAEDIGKAEEALNRPGGAAWGRRIVRRQEVMISTVEVRAASAREQQAVVDVITLAFSTDPMARWAYPDPQTYLAIMPETIRAFGGNGFAHGTVHLVDGGCAAAMWLPPGVQPDSERLEALTGQHAPRERQADMTQVFEQMGRFHPEEPCWYLPLIGVDPTSQGRGFGSALLHHALVQVDRDRVPAYLESSNPRNVPLYERHGFEVLGSIQAGSSPTLVPMLRRAR